MLRVALGCARPDTEWSGKLSGLRFDSAPGLQEIARPRDAASTILTVPRSYPEEEADLEANGECGTARLPVGGKERILDTNEGSVKI
jgi:hypothetical protein